MIDPQLARQSMGHRQIELEAESVSFLVCSRSGVTSKAETVPRVLRRPEHGGRRHRPVSDHASGRPDRDPAGSDGSDKLDK